MPSIQQQISDAAAVLRVIESHLQGVAEKLEALEKEIENHVATMGSDDPATTTADYGPAAEEYETGRLGDRCGVHFTDGDGLGWICERRASHDGPHAFPGHYDGPRVEKL